MSNECSCPFSDMKIEDLNGLEKDVLAVQCVNWINALSKNIANISKILQIAAHMPALEKCLEMFKNKATERENFDKAYYAINFATDHAIVNGLYNKPEEVIKSLFIAIKLLEEGYFWKKKLLSSLVSDQKLKTSEVWFKNHKKINLIIETFDFSRKDFDALLNEALKDNFLDDIDNWTCRKEICSLIQLFNLPKEDVYKRLEDIIRKRITFCSSLLADEISDKEIIEKTKNIKYDYLSKCLQAEEEMKIAISRESYEKIADGFIARANNSFSKEARKELTKIAANVYYLSTNDRKKIYDQNNINKTIRVASKIIGFKYKNQGLRDTWPIKYFDC